MVPQVLSIIHATFSGEERGKVFGMFGAIIGLAAVTGPLLGALLTQWDLLGLQWRPIFLINLPAGIAGLVLGRRFIDESKAPQALRLDLAGVALATAGLLLLMYPLVQGRDNGWPLWGWAMMAGGLAVLAGFVRYERVKKARDGSPLVELALFRARSFAAGIGVQLVFGVACGIFFLVWTLYMQVGLGWSPLHAGLSGLPFTVACSASAGLSVQLLVPRFGRRVLQAGALTTAAGALLYIAEAARYGHAVHSWQMALPLLVMGGGMGMVFSPLTDAVLSDVPQEHAGSASGLINTTNQLGNAFGLALVSVAFTGPTPVRAFEHAMFWMVGALAIVATLMTALPRRAARGAEPAGRPDHAAEPAKAPALAG
jgi:MFS family permease